MANILDLLRDKMNREARIKAAMEANKDGPYASLTATRGYCEALVDGEDAVAYDPSFREAFERWPTDEFKTLRRETLDRQKYYNEMHEASERILNQFKQMEKKKMTRDEAKKVLYGICIDSLEFKDALIECLEALGLIKFEEPKTPFEKLASHLGVAVVPRTLANAIEDAGLKLVEK